MKGPENVSPRVLEMALSLLAHSGKDVAENYLRFQSGDRSCGPSIAKVPRLFIRDYEVFRLLPYRKRVNVGWVRENYELRTGRPLSSSEARSALRRLVGGRNVTCFPDSRKSDYTRRRRNARWRPFDMVPVVEFLKNNEEARFGELLSGLGEGKAYRLCLPKTLSRLELDGIISSERIGGSLNDRSKLYFLSDRYLEQIKSGKSPAKEDDDGEADSGSTETDAA